MTGASEAQAPEPLVSVVIIAHNCAEYVGHAIQSVLEQTWTQLELIVVDDGSTDATAEVIKRVSDPRMKYVRQANKGPNAARNEGIRHARGEFIALLDCDDWWLPAKLEKQIERAVGHPEIGLVYSLAIRVDETGTQGDRFDSIVEGRVLDRLLLGNCIAGSASSAMVTRAAVDAVGTFDESLHYAEDWEYWIRIASQFAVACVPDFDVYLLNRPGSQGKNAQATRRDSLRFIHAALDRYAPSRPMFRRAALAQLHYVASYNLWASGLIWDARRELVRSLIYNPLHLTYYKRMVRLFFRDAGKAVMTLIAELLVALPIVLAVYSYAAYPALLWVLARRRTNALVTGDVDYQPSISVVVPAYNEETQIGGAIDALLAQDYPHDKMQILILSDASTDATDRIVSSYADRGVELMRMPKRSGKTAMENAACRLLRGEVVVNSDASIRLHPNATRKLIEQLSDPSIGVASGRDVSVSVGSPQTNVTEAEYVNYEMRLRALETRAGGIVGASGCCYAIRTDLHRLPIPPDLSRDFSAALTARAHGFRAVSVDDALAFVPRTPTLRREYTRKVRTIARGMETLLGVAHMLDPMRYGAFSWRLISHKVCRWLVPLAGVPALIGLLLLAPTHVWAALATLGVAAAAVVATIGAFWPESRPMPRLVSFVSFTVAANVAVVHAVCRLVYAGDDKIWEPTRREAIVAAP